MRRYLWGVAVLVLAGCATTARQTEALLKRSAGDFPRAVRIEGVPFIAQSANHCGPATLAMATAWAGQPISVEELTKQVYTPGAQGSYQSDLVSAARRNGLLAIPMHNMPALFTEVAAGHPVIVFENLAFTWYPMWHYALVYGYDLDAETVVMHSGPVKEKHWDLRKFERSWMLGDYWGLIVLLPGQLAASVDDLAHATAAAALEQVGRKSEAKKVYESVLTRWPESLAALIGAANLSYEDGDSVSAARYLEKATGTHPSSAVAWHNLAIAQQRLNRGRDARASAAKAFRLASAQTKAAYSQSLKELLPAAL